MKFYIKQEPASCLALAKTYFSYHLPKSKESFMSLLYWNCLKKETSAKLAIFQCPVSLIIHVVSSQLLSIHLLYSSALSPMVRLCYSILILSCKTTQELKPTGDQWVPCLMRNICNIQRHPTAGLWLGLCTILRDCLWGQFSVTVNTTHMGTWL